MSAAFAAVTSYGSSSHTSSSRNQYASTVMQIIEPSTTPSATRPMDRSRSRARTSRRAHATHLGAQPTNIVHGSHASAPQWAQEACAGAAA
jgi:hypothetical protein